MSLFIFHKYFFASYPLTNHDKGISKLTWGLVMSAVSSFLYVTSSISIFFKYNIVSQTMTRTFLTTHRDLTRFYERVGTPCLIIPHGHQNSVPSGVALSCHGQQHFMIIEYTIKLWYDLGKPITWWKISNLSYCYHVKVWIILFSELFAWVSVVLVSKVTDFQSCQK